VNNPNVREAPQRKRVLFGSKMQSKFLKQTFTLKENIYANLWKKKKRIRRRRGNLIIGDLH
jgi:hypothetical protein